MNDLIRREDALALFKLPYQLLAKFEVEALPAVTPKVKPLVWGEDRDADSEDFGAFVARSPTVHLRYIVRKVYGGGWKLTGSVPFGQPTIDTLEAAKAAAQQDYEARILAALEPVAAPDHDVVEIDLRAAMMEQIEEAASQSPWVPPEYMMNEIISDCCTFLREARAPDPAAIREAALREAAAECDRHADWIEREKRQGVYSAEGCLRTSARNILALIPTKGATK